MVFNYRLICFIELLSCFLVNSIMFHTVFPIEYEESKLTDYTHPTGDRFTFKYPLEWNIENPTAASEEELSLTSPDNNDSLQKH